MLDIEPEFLNEKIIRQKFLPVGIASAINRIATRMELSRYRN